MPMQPKSAGLLSALTKLPPIERNKSGRGSGLRRGEGGMVGEREPGGFLRGSGGVRNTTSAPTIWSRHSSSVATPLQPAAPARVDDVKAGEPSDGRSPTTAAALSGAVKRHSDQCAALTLGTPMYRLSEW